jgi:hypothetical protein
MKKTNAMSVLFEAKVKIEGKNVKIAKGGGGA